MAGIILGDESYAIVGAAIEVHRELGPGFLEAVYQEAMEIELVSRGILFVAQARIRVRYKEHTLTRDYLADLVCYDQIIVEIKALSRLSGKEEAQTINYLKATGFRLGILLNFGSHGKLEWKRLVN